MKDTVLFFRSRTLSYSSEEIFLEQIINAFQKAGFQVEVCFLGKIEQEEEKLCSFIGKSYRAIVDLNSTLPVVTVDGEYLLNQIDAPFYQVILDHPMHLEERLGVRLNRYHVVCVDEEHSRYVQKHFPHIKSVQTMYYPGIKAQREIPFEKRKYALLFAATYAPLSFFEDKLKTASQKVWTLTGEILEEMISGAGFEQAVMNVCQKRFLPQYPSLAPVAYADRYIRAWMRERLVDALVEAQVPLTVCGINWDLYAKAKELNWIGSAHYRDVIELEADAKAVLNLQPLFLDGLHDRGANAFANQCVLVSDHCKFLKRNMPDAYIDFDVLDESCGCKIKEKLERSDLPSMARLARDRWRELSLDWRFEV
ncbi:MAG: hypothetical protein K6G01_03855 [Eubacterium sp.]|nr:hypothetical protein [Eubacterium sp.]